MRIVDSLDSQLTIDTPENIYLDADVAGFGTRCMAAILDYTILIVVLLGVTFLFSRSVSLGDGNNGGMVALLILIQFVIVTFYHLLFELLWNGQTPGKYWTHIRVVQTSGLPLTVSGAVIRNLVRLFDFLPVLYGIGLIALFLTRDTQRLGDLAAKTIVVRERTTLTVGTLKENLSIRYAYLSPLEPIPHHVQIDTLTSADRQVIIDFLQRRQSLNSRARDSLARMLAWRFARQMNYPIEQDFHSSYQQRNELFLEQIARAMELTQRTGD